MAKWQKGESGNPRGRTPGTGKTAQLRALLEPQLPNLLQKLVDAAMDGDMQAMRIIIDRTIPPLKPVALPEPVTIEGETLTDQARGVLCQVAAGQIGPDAAHGVFNGLHRVRAMVEHEEMEERITQLELSLAGK